MNFIAGDNEIREIINTPAGPKEMLTKKCTILRMAPYNTQKNDLTDLFGKAFTVAEIVKMAVMNPSEFMSRFSEVHTVILDECGLIDEWTFCTLINLGLRKLFKLARVVITADQFQLGAISGGQPYLDLLSHAETPIMRLLVNHRTKPKARQLFHVVEGINKRDESWIYQMEQKEMKDCLTLVPTPINDDELKNPNSSTQQNIRMIAEKILNDPVHCQVICHSNKMVQWMNRQIMACSEAITGHCFLRPDEVQNERVGKCDMNPMTLHVGERVVLKEKKQVYLPKIMQEKYPHLPHLYTLENNELFLIRAFTSHVNQNPFLGGGIINSNGMSGSQSWNFGSYMWLQKIDRKLRDEKDGRLHEQDTSLWIPIPWESSLLKVIKPSYCVTIDVMQGNQCREVFLLLESTFSRRRLTTAVGRATDHIYIFSTHASEWNRRMPTPPQMALLDAARKDDPERLSISGLVLKNRKAEKANQKKENRISMDVI